MISSDMEQRRMAAKSNPIERKITYKNITIPYTLIKSARTSYAISISVDKGVVIRTPKRMNELFLEKMLREKEEWIITKYEEVLKARARRASSQYNTKQKEEIRKRYIKAAREYFPKRVQYYVNEIYWEDNELYDETNLPYRSITIREQKTRWGSCSSNGTLSFNVRLMLAPPAVLDYVVVHELCHIKHMNHSKEFWELVGSILPDYKERRKWLKEHGNELYL